MSRIVFIGMVICILSGCNPPKCQTGAETSIVGQHYIAHAGGSIDGHVYTNSKEAVEHAIACGITFIELDFCLTSDGQLVAAHDWEFFNEITTGVKDVLPISMKEFRERKILGRYTPLTYVEIDSIWKANPSLVLVTDKISEPAIIEQYFSHMRERVVVECFDEEHYRELKSLGYLETLLSACPIEKQDEETLPFRGFAFWHGNSGGLPACITERSGGEVYAVFSYRDRQAADAVFKLDERIKLIYIDHVESY